jgi:transcriptional regulator with XRE-family HTH domain
MTVDPLAAFGTRLRTLREEHKLSQEKLARLRDLHRNYVGKLERGNSNVSLLTIAKLAHSLNVKPVKLVESVRQNGCPMTLRPINLLEIGSTMM